MTGVRGDERWTTSADVVHDVARRCPDRVAVVDADRSLSYAELDREVGRLAVAMTERRVSKGARVAVWAPNSWRWMVAALATHLVGAILVPVNTRFKGDEVDHVMAGTRPDAIFVEQGFLDIDFLSILGDSAPRLVVDLASDPSVSPTVSSWEHVLTRDVDTDLVDGLLLSADRHAPADIMFTSGTTGYPKGVVATHAQNLRAFHQWAGLAGMGLHDRYAITNPFFHTFGYKAGWLSAVMLEMTVHPHRVLDPGALAEQIERERITLLAGPPTLFDAVIDRSRRDRLDFGSVRTTVVGATSIPARLVRQLREQVGVERVTTCYGLTEVTGVATITAPTDAVDVVALTAGRPVPDVEVAVLDEDSRNRPADVDGEICVRGYNVTPGYFAGGVVEPPSLDAEGYLHTGDVGHLDHDGNLHVVDRLDDMFVVGGFNAYPAEIERLLAEHPSIADVAVIGVPDDRLGQVAAAFVVPRPDTDIDAARLVSWARGRMANYKAPRVVHVVPELPRNASGKVLRRELRRRPPGW